MLRQRDHQLLEEPVDASRDGCAGRAGQTGFGELLPEGVDRVEDHLGLGCHDGVGAGGALAGRDEQRTAVGVADDAGHGQARLSQCAVVLGERMRDLGLHELAEHVAIGVRHAHDRTAAPSMSQHRDIDGRPVAEGCERLCRALRGRQMLELWQGRVSNHPTIQPEMRDFCAGSSERPRIRSFSEVKTSSMTSA